MPSYHGHKFTYFLSNINYYHHDLRFLWLVFTEHVGIKWSALGNFLRRFCGLTEAFLWIGWRRAEGSTSCRRLVIATANARRCDNEGSPCKRWKLDVSVKSQETFSLTNGQIGIRRTKASLESKELSLPDARDSFSNHADYCVFQPPLWDNLTLCHQKLAEMICNTK